MRIRAIALAALACASSDSALIAQGREAFATRFSASAVAGVLRVDDQGLGFNFESSGGPRYQGSSDLAPLVGATVRFTIVPFLVIYGIRGRGELMEVLSAHGTKLYRRCILELRPPLALALIPEHCRSC
ncbi:hypothetical protein BH20GEM1_BH20GEM1_14760 [soil metagenome]